MARKTTGTTTGIRRKKVEAPAPPEVVQVAPKQVAPIAEEKSQKKIRKDVPANGTTANHVPAISASANIEEEIRNRAYELYLQRASRGEYSGDQHQDWLIAEREIRSRQGDPKQRSAAAGGMRA
ncbi:MAG: DUF2934 domain-containing protein [Terriglobales bacterium]